MRTKLICGSLAIVLGALPMYAKKSPGPTRIMGPDESFQTAKVDNRTVRLDNGITVTAHDTGFVADPAAPEQMARQYLARHWEQLGLLRGDLADLELHAVRTGKAATVVRFRQVVAGVPVLGSQVAVSLDEDGRVIYYSSSYQPADLVDARPRVSMDTARALARATLGLTSEPTWEDSQLVAYYSQGVTRLAYRTRQLGAEGLVGEWEVLTDAQTGEVLRIQDQANYGGTAVGEGDLFLPDPLSSSGATYGDPGYVDGSDADTPELVAEIFRRTFPEVSHDPCLQGTCTYELKSSYAEIVDTEGPFNGLYEATPDPQWYATRVDDLFEASNTFYHIDRFMRYMNEDLGVTVQAYQYGGGARFDPHGLNGADNSHYTSGNGVVAFGEGGVDDAEDADVVIHELGHAIHDWVTSGGLSQVNGLSEGTGDYFAQSYSRSLPETEWTTGDPAYHYVFSWDGHNPFWGGRTTNYGAVYPGGLVGQIHTDGQIWATCNMRVWDEIGAEAMDTAMLEGLAMTGSSTNQEDAAIAIMAAAEAMGYSFQTLTDMYDIYVTCVYNVPPPMLTDEIFADGFESGDTTAW